MSRFKLDVYSTGVSIVVALWDVWTGVSGKSYASLRSRRYIPRARVDLARRAVEKLDREHGPNIVEWRVSVRGW